MTDKMVLGMGNALTDMLVEASDEMLDEFELPKGGMQLVDRPHMQRLLAGITPARHCAGGCASNTITGLGELGVQTAFIGKVGRDDIGRLFEQDLVAHGVESRLVRGDSPSGTSLAFITPDSERTFATWLGASVELTAADLRADMFAGAHFFHIEGYLVQNHDLISSAIDHAKASGAAVSIDLASYNVVEENLEFLKGLVGKGLDVIFANEDEAKAFTGLEAEQALDVLAGHCRIAVVKLGKDGSHVARGGERVQTASEPVALVDTTGAGDLYATGFLYGLATNQDIETCARIGTIVAREVIQVKGTKLDEHTWRRIKEAIRAW